jgi:hypothetical protein
MVTDSTKINKGHEKMAKAKAFEKRATEIARRFASISLARRARESWVVMQVHDYYCSDC